MNKWWIRSAGLPRYFTFACFQTKVFAWHCPTARSAPTKMHTWLGKPGLTHLATSFANKQTSPDHPHIRWRWRTTNISILSCKKHLTCRCFIISIFALGIQLFYVTAFVENLEHCWQRFRLVIDTVCLPLRRRIDMPKSAAASSSIKEVMGAEALGDEGQWGGFP